MIIVLFSGCNHVYRLLDSFHTHNFNKINSWTVWAAVVQPKRSIKKRTVQVASDKLYKRLKYKNDRAL
jgi:hypothetical protein